MFKKKKTTTIIQQPDWLWLFTFGGHFSICPRSFSISLSSVYYGYVYISSNKSDCNEYPCLVTSTYSSEVWQPRHFKTVLILLESGAPPPPSTVVMGITKSALRENEMPRKRALFNFLMAVLVKLPVKMNPRSWVMKPSHRPSLMFRNIPGEQINVIGACGITLRFDDSVLKKGALPECLLRPRPLIKPCDLSWSRLDVIHISPWMDPEFSFHTGNTFRI